MEVAHVMDADKEARANMKGLQDIVGDSINSIETVVCTNAAYGARVREHIREKDLRLCLWIADQLSNKLLLEPYSTDSMTEIKKGRLHGDGKLTRLLIGGVDSIGVKPVPFLPSSHPCTLLVETIPLLDLKLREASLDRFGLSDIHTILKGTLLNIADEELLKLGELIVKSGLEPEIFHDPKPWISSMRDKEYEIAVRRSTVRAIVDDIREKYIDFHSVGKAEEKSIKKFDEEGFRESRSLKEFGF